MDRPDTHLSRRARTIAGSFGALAVTAALAIAGVAAGGAPAGSGEHPRCAGPAAIAWACHENRYHLLVHTAGVETALRALRNDYERDDFIRANCHELAHVIGHAALHEPGALAAVLASDEDFCEAGHKHGVIEGRVAELARGGRYGSLDAVCAPVRSRRPRSIEHHHCAHPLGHGLMLAAGNDLRAALRACDTLADGWERGRCHGGAFMENVKASIGPHAQGTRYARPRQPLFPCTAIADRYRSACLGKQVLYALRQRENDFAAVFRLCASQLRGRQLAACHEGLGANAAWQSIGGHVTDAAVIQATRALCDRGPGEPARSGCVSGAVTLFAYHFAEASPGRRFCAALATRLRRACARRQAALERML